MRTAAESELRRAGVVYLDNEAWDATVSLAVYARLATLLPKGAAVIGWHDPAERLGLPQNVPFSSAAECRLGAFEVSTVATTKDGVMTDVLFYSKILSNIWPHVGTLTAKISRYFEDQKRETPSSFGGLNLKKRY